MMPSTLVVMALSLSPALTGPPRLLAPAATCHATIDARCSSLRGEEALRCHNEADAQCDISDAEQFIAAGDVTDAMTRLDQARTKYEDLLNMMLADPDATPIAETMIRYAAGNASIFALLAREGEVEDMNRAALRLQRAHDFLLNLIVRRPELAGRPDLDGALKDLTTRLAAALDQLARREMRRAGQRYRAVRGVKAGDGGARSYYEDAVRHSAAAHKLVPNFAYKLVEFDAELAQAELSTLLARNDPAAAAPACVGYRKLRHELAEIQRATPNVWKEHPQLHDFQGRAERGARACAARPRIVAGGAMIGVGAAGLVAALGLYAHYDAACAYSPELGACADIKSGSPDVDRFTTQVRASIGLAVVGGVLLAAGATVLVHGLVQQQRAKPRRFSLTPTFGPHHTGAALGLRF